jgi:acyl-coenzyme A synthetase/AMP-(fatty) acid ligase
VRCGTPAGHPISGHSEWVLARVRAELPPEKWVRVLEFVPSLPRTASGKVRRAELRAWGAVGVGFHVDPPAD